MTNKLKTKLNDQVKKLERKKTWYMADSTSVEETDSLAHILKSDLNQKLHRTVVYM